MDDKHKSNPPKGMGKSEEKPSSKPAFEPFKVGQAAPPPIIPAPEVAAAPSKAAAFPGATFDVDQTPPPPVEKAAPVPKPVPNAPNVKKAEGITYIGKYKKFHAEFKTGGRTINVGLFDTEKEAIKALNREKAEYNL